MELQFKSEHFNLSKISLIIFKAYYFFTDDLDNQELKDSHQRKKCPFHSGIDRNYAKK